MGTKPMNTFLTNLLTSAHNNGAVVHIHDTDFDYNERKIIVHDVAEIAMCTEDMCIEDVCVGPRTNRVPMTKSAIRQAVSSARLVEIHTFEMGVRFIVANGTTMWING